MTKSIQVLLICASAASFGSFDVHAEETAPAAELTVKTIESAPVPAAPEQKPWTINRTCVSRGKVETIGKIICNSQDSITYVTSDTGWTVSQAQGNYSCRKANDKKNFLSIDTFNHALSHKEIPTFEGHVYAGKEITHLSLSNIKTTPKEKIIEKYSMILVHPIFDDITSQGKPALSRGHFKFGDADDAIIEFDSVTCTTEHVNQYGL